MYGVAGANRPIFTESDAYFYNLDDPNLGSKPNIIPKQTVSHSTIRVLISHVILVRTSLSNLTLEGI